MTLGGALLLTGLAVAAVGALAHELLLANRQVSHRWLRAAAGWLPITMIAVGWLDYSSSYDLGSAAASGLMFGPPAYLIARVFFWLSARDPTQQAAANDRAERERLRYRATDFDGRATLQDAVETTLPRRLASPLNLSSPAPIDSRLASATTEKRSPWAGRIEVAIASLAAGLLVLLCAGSMLLDGRRRGNFDGREALAAALELNGFGAANVNEVDPLDRCGRREKSYEWGSLGATGQACVSWDGGVKLWVNRRWSHASPPPSPPLGGPPPP